MSINYDEQTDFFDANMKLLKKNHPHIWTAIKKNPPEPEGEIILAPNGEPNLWTKDINGNRVSLHIPENPRAEINDIFRTVDKNFTGTLIITGMGLGYCTTAITEQLKNLRHLIVFEPNSGIFMQALKANDLFPLLSDHRVILGIGEDQNIAAIMAPATKALQLETIQHIKHNPSFSLDFSKYDTLYQEINNHTSSANAEGNTFLTMGNDFFTNRLKHLNSIHHNYFFDDLRDKFKDIPAILVSAGPSLDENIHILKQAKGKSIILAVDSALPSLIANGIMPDFVTTIDPLELIYEKVSNVAEQVRNVSLICMSWASSKMTKLFPASNNFWCFGAKDIERWMANLVGCKTITAGATSVAHLNLLSATMMGCSPVVFIGQDCSFSQSKSHSSNMTLQIKDKINRSLKDKDNIVWLDGIDGNKVASNRTFHSLKRYLETMIKQNEGYYINATAKGALIDGTTVMSLQEVVDQFCTATIDNSALSDLSLKKNPALLRGRLINELQKKIKKCQEIKRMLKETSYLLRDLSKIFNSNKNFKGLSDLSNTNQKKLAKLDKIGNKLDNINDIWSLMQEVTMAGLRKSEQQKHAIDFLANNPEKYTQWLKQSLQRLDTINNVRKELLPLLQDTIQEDVNILQSEEQLLALLNRQEDKKNYNQNLIKIVTLYFDSGNITLAQPWLKKLFKNLPNSVEANYCMGITAAHYTDYNKAESFFTKAIKIDPTYTPLIEKFRNNQGDAYISYAQFFDNKDKTVARRLLLKGLIYAPEHKKIRQELKLQSDHTITAIKNHEREHTLPDAEDMIDSWLDDLSSYQQLTSIIENDNASQLNYYKGMISVGKEDFDLGIDHFINALDITPDNPVLHISLTDAYFAIEDFPKGINHLKQAAALDSVYAVYWEEIGDELMHSGQFEDALAAFENCFVILPERVHLLKKIGDCYQETGQLEAAKEAYANLNALLKES